MSITLHELVSDPPDVHFWTKGTPGLLNKLRRITPEKVRVGELRRVRRPRGEGYCLR